MTGQFTLCMCVHVDICVWLCESVLCVCVCVWVNAALLSAGVFGSLFSGSGTLQEFSTHLASRKAPGVRRVAWNWQRSETLDSCTATLRCLALLTERKIDCVSISFVSWLKSRKQKDISNYLSKLNMLLHNLELGIPQFLIVTDISIMKF